MDVQARRQIIHTSPTCNKSNLFLNETNILIMKQNKDRFAFSACNKLSAVGLPNARQIQLKGFSVHTNSFLKSGFPKDSCII